MFTSPTGGNTTSIKPYDGADAQLVIQAVNTRSGGAHRTRASMSAGPAPTPAAAAAQAHIRGVSVNLAQLKPVGNPNGFISQSSSLQSNISAIGREPSPTLPSIPNQPTLDALISSSLATDGPRNGSPPSSEGERSAPKIGDPGRRMVGHHLGIRHPALGPRAVSSHGGSGGADLKDLHAGVVSD